MKYSIQTVSDSSYFPFLKIFINSILQNCDIIHINKIYIIDTGLTSPQLDWLSKKSSIIEIKSTGLSTNFNGGTWGDDWQLNVKGKTKWLLQTIKSVEEPVLMLDSDMMIMQDLHQLLNRGGDIQVCVRNKPSCPYIGSYFFSINHKKSIPFIQKWIEITNLSNEKKAHESPALCMTLPLFRNDLQIVEIDELEVNLCSPPLYKQTIIVHFKGTKLDSNIHDAMNNRLIKRGWSNEIRKYV